MKRRTELNRRKQRKRREHVVGTADARGSDTTTPQTQTTMVLVGILYRWGWLLKNLGHVPQPIRLEVAERHAQERAEVEKQFVRTQASKRDYPLEALDQEVPQ